MLETADLQELAEDIRQHGQRHKIIVDTEDRIIDGRNRWRACEIAGKTPQTEVYDEDDGQILDLVISLNVNRRHLSESQRAMVAATISNMKVGKPKQKNDIASIEAISNPVLTQSSAAKSLNVSRASVQRAATVQRDAVPEVQAAVVSGEVSVSRAAKIAEKPKAEQPAALAEATSPRKSQFDPVEIEKQSRKRNGAPTIEPFDDKPVDKAVGVIRRHLDLRLEARPGTDRHFNKSKFALNEFVNAYTEWKDAK